jgi:hypothetical protein
MSRSIVSRSSGFFFLMSHSSLQWTGGAGLVLVCKRAQCKRNSFRLEQGAPLRNLCCVGLNVDTLACFIEQPIEIGKIRR